MKKEYRELPARYKPISSWGYFGLTVLYAIPVIGWIFFLVFTFHRGNINRRNFTRSRWIGFLICLLLSIVSFFVITGSMGIRLTEIPGLVKDFRGIVMQGVRTIRGEQSLPAPGDLAIPNTEGAAAGVRQELIDLTKDADVLADSYIQMKQDGTATDLKLMGLIIKATGLYSRATALGIDSLSQEEKDYVNQYAESLETRLEPVGGIQGVIDSFGGIDAIREKLGAS